MNVQPHFNIAKAAVTQRLSRTFARREAYSKNRWSTKHRSLARLAFFLTSVGVSAGLQAAVITNGNFEATVIASGTFELATNANLPGWTVTYPAGANANSLLKVESGGFGINAQSGDQYLVFGGSGQNGASIGQLVNSFVVGDTYELSFWLTLQQIPRGGPYTESIAITIGNEFSEVFSIAQSTASWVQFSYSFVASTSAYNIVFRDLADLGDVQFNLGLDNLVIDRIGGPGNGVPIPASAALVGLGLLATGRARRACLRPVHEGA